MGVCSGCIFPRRRIKMSEFHAIVVKIGPIEKHPNADSLGITKVWDYPVIVRLEEFQPGDLAVYVPVDSVVPDQERWAFLKGHMRIRAVKLRGVYSMGLLTRAEEGMVEGEEVAERMGITRWEPVEPESPDDERDPGFIPSYTDIEGIRRWPGMLIEGEHVVITEKIHGECSRFVYKRERLWQASKINFKKPGSDTPWNRAAKKYGLEAKLGDIPGLAIFGEVSGSVRGMKYGTDAGSPRLTLFDSMDIRTRKYDDYAEFTAIAAALDLPTVPILYRGPWTASLRSLAEGKTTVEGADHVREGMVVKPVRERWDDRIGRVILKLHGEGFNLRKER